MNDQPDPIPWDFLSIVDCWNLYGLPLLLALALTLAITRRARAATIDAALIARHTARRLGLIHYLIAMGFLLALIQELIAIQNVRAYFSVASIFALILQFYIPALAFMANALIGFGLRRLSRVARILAIFWNLLCSALAALSIWLIYSGAYFDPARWPDLFVTKLLPLTLFILLLSPRVKTAFITRLKVEPAPSEEAKRAEMQPNTVRDRVLSLITLLLLLIVASTVVVDLGDWIVRATFPSDLDATMITG